MTSLPEAGAACVRGTALTGIHAELIEVRATVSTGAPGFAITGVPDDQTRETRDRVRAAIVNSHYPWPSGDVTVSAGLASHLRHGCGLDLPIAVAILAASGVVPPAATSGCVFAAGLGLDGRLRQVSGIVPVVTAAAADGYTTAVVAPENWPEAVMAPGVVIAPYESLRQVVAWLRRELLPWELYVPAPRTPQPPAELVAPGLAGLSIPPVLRQVLEVAAAGGHHLCLTGPRGAAIPALAAGLANMLPDLDEQQADEVTAIHSAAGLLGSGRARITRPPLRIPHHTVTMAALAGGGCNLRPGEAALAHRGVLCLHDAPEFERRVIDVLRQPLRDREIAVARGGAIARFPARFILVAGMRPCPCGAPAGCACTPLQARRYRQRVTGTLGAWIPLRLAVDRPTFAGTTSGPPGQDADAGSAAQVAEARDRTRHRLAGTPWQVNNEIPRTELRRSYPPAPGGAAVIDHASDLGLVSGPAAGRVTAVAWTLADLAGKPRPARDECAQALAFWTGAAR